MNVTYLRIEQEEAEALFSGPHIDKVCDALGAEESIAALSGFISLALGHYRLKGNMEDAPKPLLTSRQIEGVMEVVRRRDEDLSAKKRVEKFLQSTAEPSDNDSTPQEAPIAKRNNPLRR